MLQDQELLQYYAAEWDRYTAGVRYLKGLFRQLDSWVKHERDEGKKQVYQVYTVSGQSSILRRVLLIDDPCIARLGPVEDPFLRPYPER
jgi:hypothetical protein